MHISLKDNEIFVFISQANAYKKNCDDPHEYELIFPSHLRSIGHKATVKIGKEIHPVSFTSVDAFTFIIRGWVEEVVTLGVSPNLMCTVLSLWAKYLGHMHLAFVEDQQCRRQILPGPGLAPSFRDVQVGIYKRRRIITASELGHKRASRSRQKARQHLVDYSVLDQDENSREARRVRSKMRRNFHKQLAKEKAAADRRAEEQGAVSEDSATSFLSDASFLSCSGRLDCGPESSLLNSSSSVASAIDEVEEEKHDVIEYQTRAIERITLHIPNIRNSSMEQTCRLTIRNVYSLFSLGVFLHGDPKVTLTTSDLAMRARSGAISYSNASIHVPELLVMRGNEDANKFICRHPPTRTDLQESIYRMGSFLQLVKVNLGCPEIFCNVLQRFLEELSLPRGLENEIMRTFASTKYFEFNAELLPRKSRRSLRRMPAMDERALGVIIFALKCVYGLDDSDVKDDLNQSDTYEVAAEGKAFNLFTWIKLSRHRAFWANKRSHVLRQRLGKLFPGVELTESAAINEAERNALMTKIARAHMVTNTGTMVYVTKFQDNLALKLKTEVFSKNYGGESLEEEDANVDLSSSLTPLKDYTEYRLKCLEKSKMQNSFKQEEFEVLEKLSAMRESTLKIMIDSGDVETSESRHQMSAAPSSFAYSEKLKSNSFSEDFNTHVWRIELTSKCQKMGHIADGPLEEEILSAVPENFGWLLRYLCTYFDCSIVEVYRNLQEAETLALNKDKSYFGKMK